MKEPTRLIHEEGSGLERLFLTHAGQEEPDSAAMALLLAPFADGAATGPTAAIEPRTAHVPTGGGAGAASIQPGAPSMVGPILAWSGAGVVALGLAALGLGRLAGPPNAPNNSGRDVLTVQTTALGTGADGTGPSTAQTGTSERGSGHINPAQWEPGQTHSTQPESAPPHVADARRAGAPQTDALTAQARPLQGQTQSAPPTRANPDRSVRANTETDVARGEALPRDVAAATLTPQSSLNLRDELALLEQVRTSLRAGQVDAALRRLSRYDERFPQGELREEALVLRMEALKAAGQEAALRDLRTQFLVDHPDSPHKARIEGTSPQR